jgi:hypothetical protein
MGALAQDSNPVLRTDDRDHLSSAMLTGQGSESCLAGGCGGSPLPQESSLLSPLVRTDNRGGSGVFWVLNLSLDVLLRAGYPQLEPVKVSYSVYMKYTQLKR